MKGGWLSSFQKIVRIDRNLQLSRNCSRRLLHVELFEAEEQVQDYCSHSEVEAFIHGLLLVNALLLALEVKDCAIDPLKLTRLINGRFFHELPHIEG